MNKCVKIEIKNYFNYKQVLRDLRYQSWLACNKAMIYYYTFNLEKIEYKNLNGINIDEKNKFGKSYMTWVEDHMKKVMNIHNTRNISQTNQKI